MDFIIVITILLFLPLGYKIFSEHPEWGVVLGLVPSIFFTEDYHENFFITDESLRIQTFDSIKIAGYFRPTEIIILLLLLVLIGNYHKHRERLASPLNREIILLLILCPIAGIVSALRGADPVFALSYHAWRSFWWAMVFFFYCLYALEPSKVEEYFKIFYMAIFIRMTYGIVKFLLGFGETHNVYVGTSIVFWDGLDLHLASSLAVISIILLFEKTAPIKRTVLNWGVVISIFVILFSLRRGAIANVVFTILALFIFFPLKHKRTLISGMIIAFIVGVALLFLSSGGSGASTDVVLERIGQVFATDLATTHEFHYFDPIDHFLAIIKQPILGLGFGMPFERTFLATMEQETTFSHNAYLFVWGGMGIFGLIVYILLYGKTIRISNSLFRSLDGSMLPIAIIGIILTGLVQGVYSTTNFTSSRMPFVLFFATSLLIKLSNRQLEANPLDKQKT